MELDTDENCRISPGHRVESRRGTDMKNLLEKSDSIELTIFLRGLSGVGSTTFECGPFFKECQFLETESS